MKKSFPYLLVFVFIALSQWGLTAQNVPDAKSILDKVNAKYKAMKAFRAYFTYNLSSPGTGVSETFKGEIIVKEESFYLRLPDQHVITNGKTQWTFLRDANEVTVTEYAPDEDEITPNKIYGIYEKDYDYAYVEEKLESGKAYHIIDLKPKNREGKSLFKIRLKIVKSSNSIKSWEIFEKNSNRYLYEIDKFAVVKVSDNYFKYNSSRYDSDPELVDLR